MVGLCTCCTDRTAPECCFYIPCASPKGIVPFIRWLVQHQKSHRSLLAKERKIMENAITVNDVTKIYRMYDKPIDRLKESLHPRHKEYHKKFYALNKISFQVKRERLWESLEPMVQESQPF